MKTKFLLIGLLALLASVGAFLLVDFIKKKKSANNTGQGASNSGETKPSISDVVADTPTKTATDGSIRLRRVSNIGVNPNLDIAQKEDYVGRDKGGTAYCRGKDGSIYPCLDQSVAM